MCSFDENDKMKMKIDELKKGKGQEKWTEVDVLK
jgi:hypothetical protein